MPLVRQRTMRLQIGLTILLLLGVSAIALDDSPVRGVTAAGTMTPNALGSPTVHASPIASPRASPVAQGRGPGSITVAFFGCPASVGAVDANTSVCVPIVGGTGASVDSESEGVLLTLAEAKDNGDGSYTWTGLRLGIYNVTDVVLPPDYEGNYVINRDSPEAAHDESLVMLRKDGPDAHFSVFGLGGLPTS
jgi:hypothetical protein